jgi:hypothetical protein
MAPQGPGNDPDFSPLYVISEANPTLSAEYVNETQQNAINTLFIAFLFFRV